MLEVSRFLMKTRPMGLRLFAKTMKAKVYISLGAVHLTIFRPFSSLLTTIGATAVIRPRSKSGLTTKLKFWIFSFGA